jgi:Xaa-Pro aminopeptidase
VALDRAARAVVEDAGYGEAFTHGLGHGVGLVIHEPPWLSSSEATAGTLPGRSTVTVEPGIYLPGRGGVRIEDTVDVADDHDGGVQVLTRTTKTLLVVD